MARMAGSTALATAQDLNSGRIKTSDRTKRYLSPCTGILFALEGKL
jgi:hypothetical protein